MIGKKISHYHIIEKIGEGGMGVIYRAEDTRLKREVALKFLPHHLAGSEEDRTRFMNEARAVSALNHPNITTIYEIDEVGQDTFIAMEFLHGETLADIIARKRLTNRDIMDVGESISKALVEAHNLEIIHRDIKSENIMILKTGAVKIMDFGLAKRKGDNLITKKGVTMGTVAYMSPEQVEGKNVDHRTDIFSLGVIMYEMATGTMPFRGEHEASVLYSIVNETPVLPKTINPDIHPDLERLIMRLLEKKAEKRYQSALTLVSDLETLKDNLDSKQFMTRTIVPEHVTDESITRLSGNRKFPLLAGAAVIVLAVTAALFWDNLNIMIPGLTNQGSVAAMAESGDDNSLAVLYFENLEDPEDTQRLGQILQELVIADLSEMSSLKVFSSRRLFDLQKQLGSESRKIIDPDLATEIAQRAGASKMLTGKVMNVGDKTIITSQLIDTYDGSIIESQRVEGSDLYVLVDELVHQIQGELEVRQEDRAVASQMVKEKTSSSVTAFQAYLEGMDQFYDSHFVRAADKFKEAVSLDSTFTRAYYELAMSLWWNSSLDGGPEAKNEARQIIERIKANQNLSTKDRLLFNAAHKMIQNDYTGAEEAYNQLVTLLPDEKDAWFGLGEALFHGSHDPEKTLNAFEQVLKLDPDFSLAYRHIFDIYKEQGSITRGLVRANQYMSLNPEDPWGYIYTGDMLIERGNVNGAIESLSTGLELDPGNVQALKLFSKLAQGHPETRLEFQSLLENLLESNPDEETLYIYLANLYLLTGEPEKVEEIVARGLEKFPENIVLLETLARNHVSVGDLYSALDLIDERIVSSTALNDIIKLNHLKSSLLARAGKYTEAIENLENTRNTNLNLGQTVDREFTLSILLWYYFGLGDAEKSREMLENNIYSENENVDNNQIYYAMMLYHFLEGNKVQFADMKNKFDNPLYKKFIGVYDKASILLLENKIDAAALVIDSLEFVELYDFALAYELVLADISNGNFERAEKFINRFTNQSTSLIGTIYFSRSFYLKGLLHEAKGENDLAVEAFERLLEVWIDADNTIPELQDTYARLVKLKRPS